MVAEDVVQAANAAPQVGDVIGIGIPSGEFHVGTVVAVDSLGVRISHVDWLVGYLGGGAEYFVPWTSVASVQFAKYVPGNPDTGERDSTSDTQMVDLDQLANAQTRWNNRYQPERATTADESA